MIKLTCSFGASVYLHQRHKSFLFFGFANSTLFTCKLIALSAENETISGESIDFGFISIYESNAWINLNELTAEEKCDEKYTNIGLQQLHR